MKLKVKWRWIVIRGMGPSVVVLHADRTLTTGKLLALFGRARAAGPIRRLSISSESSVSPGPSHVVSSERNRLFVRGNWDCGGLVLVPTASARLHLHAFCVALGRGKTSTILYRA